MKSLRKNLVGVLALVIATSAILIAQPADQTSLPTEPAPSAEPEVTLTLPEMTEQIGTFSETVVADTKIVEQLQQKARKQQDVIKLNCINDALLQIKALRNIIDLARGAFEASANETENRTHYKSIADNTNNVRQLRERANICAGEGELVSDTRNSFEAPEIPDDPTQDMFPDSDVLEPPGFASPFN